jgi:hypothetical protein
MMREAERLNLLPDLKEQRSMQVMQPAHLAGSASINRLPFTTLTVMVCAREKSRPDYNIIITRPAHVSLKFNVLF